MSLYLSSQPARAVWIEIITHFPIFRAYRSQPARAVWIEICLFRVESMSLWSQPARAVWIEIMEICFNRVGRRCHSLRGLCGLKCSLQHSKARLRLSQPARAVWIEMYMKYGGKYWNVKSQPARAVWIEICLTGLITCSTQSQPARAVWIEILGQIILHRQMLSHSLRGLCGLKYYL